MSDQPQDQPETNTAPPASAEAVNPQPQKLDPAFFACVNEYLELANKQARQYGPKRVSAVSLYAAARFNAHAFLGQVGQGAAADRTRFLDYMADLYRRMLNEHLDGLGAERGIDVGPSELAAEYAAAAAAQAERDAG
jgi:hypothetical protein